MEKVKRFGPSPFINWNPKLTCRIFFLKTHGVLRAGAARLLLLGRSDQKQSLTSNPEQGRYEQEVIRFARICRLKILYQQINSHVGHEWRPALFYPDEDDHLAKRHMKEIHGVRGCTLEMDPRWKLSEHHVGKQNLFSLLQNAIQRAGVVPHPLFSAWPWVTPSLLALDSSTIRCSKRSLTCSGFGVPWDWVQHPDHLFMEGEV